jgi:hypothetical protein
MFLQCLSRLVVLLFQSDSIILLVGQRIGKTQCGGKSGCLHHFLTVPGTRTYIHPEESKRHLCGRWQDEIVDLFDLENGI